MPTQLDDVRSALERYRGVTLQCLDMITDAEMAWRPRPDAFSVGQQFVHILQTEEFYVPGLFGNEWDMNRVRFPAVLPSRAELRREFSAVRAKTLAHLAAIDDEKLGAVVSPPHAPGIEATLRAWLYFIVEHEIHHKGQLAEYMRALGHVPPYFGMVLPAGARPDIAAREALGGV